MIEAERTTSFTDYNVKVHNCNIEVMAGILYPEDGQSLNLSATGSLTPNQARELIKAIKLAIDLAEKTVTI